MSPDTAGRILEETLPDGGKPLQVLTLDRNVRSIHGARYTRLHHLELLAVVKEFETDFQPPQTGCNEGKIAPEDWDRFLELPTGAAISLCGRLWKKVAMEDLECLKAASVLPIPDHDDSEDLAYHVSTARPFRERWVEARNNKIRSLGRTSA